MNDHELRQLAESLTRLLKPQLERSEPLRTAAALVGQWLIEQAAAAGATSVPGVSGTPASGTAAAECTNAVASPPEAPATNSGALSEPALAAAIVPLRIGDAVVHVPVSGTSEELARAVAAADVPSVTTDHDTTTQPVAPGRAAMDLPLVVVRCRLKAESCRHSISLRGVGGEPAAADSRRAKLNSLIAQAKGLDRCFLWAFMREWRQPSDAMLGRIAACYDVHAGAAALVHRLDQAGTEPAGEDETLALALLAEANSALRVALLDSPLSTADHDQNEVHHWLRDRTSARQIFVSRHMTIDDPADPDGVDNLAARIRFFDEQLSSHARRSKAVQTILNSVRFHARHIIKKGREASLDHWSKIAAGLIELTAVGVAPSDRRVTEAAAALSAALLHPDASELRGIPELVARVEAAEATPAADDSAQPRQWSPDILEVRRFLRGRRMVIIGGVPNPEAIRRFTDAFTLSAAEWVELTEHGTGAPMRAPIFRSDTAVVLVIIKLTGHLHAEEARTIAEDAGKPCVLLAGGYNPQRVAQDILEQASTRLSVVAVQGATTAAGR